VRILVIYGLLALLLTYLSFSGFRNGQMMEPAISAFVALYLL